MTSEEIVRIAFRNLERQKTRSFLTILAIIIGMGSVVMFLTLGLGFQSGINEQFELIGGNKIFIAPSTSVFSFGGTTSTLDEDDLDLINSVSGIKESIGMVYGIGRTVYKDEQKYLWVGGMDPDGFELFESAQGFYIENGRLPKRGEDAIVVGWLYLNGEVFEENIKMGRKLEIEGREFKIVGSFSQVGNSQDDSSIWMPLDVAKEVLGKNSDEYDFIFSEVATGANTSLVAEKIKEELRDDRDLEVGDEDFSVETSEEIIDAFNEVLGIVFVGVIGIASISLLVGGVGIMNTMYTSVLDRTREIGVMKAIGATNSRILLIFLIESGFIGLVGGAIGIIGGLSLSYLAEYIAFNYLLTTLLKVYLDPLLLIGILVFSFGIGCISGFLPARRAAKMKPVDALRYE